MAQLLAILRRVGHLDRDQPDHSGLLVDLFGVDAVLANVLATVVGTVPSFELNRRWVWFDQSQRSVLRQVTPFCTLSFAGLVISTLTVRARLRTHDRPQSGWHTWRWKAANDVRPTARCGWCSSSCWTGCCSAPSSIGRRSGRGGAPQQRVEPGTAALRR